MQCFELGFELAIQTAEIDFVGALSLAEETGLTGYDASYLWPVRHLKAELVTPDRESERVATGIAPSS